MITAMYLRKSRAEENEPIAQTLSRHRDILTSYATKESITVADVYEEVASGDSLYGRPQMLRLLENISKYDAVLCMDIDRLGRGAMREQGLIFETVRNAGVLIVTPAKTFDMNDDMDDSLISFKALFAREEYKMIRGRLRRGTIKAVEEGCYLSNAPYGYTQIRVNKKPTLSIEPREADAIRLIFDLYIKGSGCQHIADTLHAAGYRPRRGEKFNRTTIAKILRNPVYIGKVVWNQYSFERPKTDGQKHIKRLKPSSEWLVSNGLHDAIIDSETFEKANAVMSHRYHPPYRKPDELQNPLAGILFCQNCGRAMVRLPLNNKKYNQPIIICPVSGCCMSSSQTQVEQFFYDGLSKLMTMLKSTAPESEAIPINTVNILDTAKNELDKLKKQLSKQHDMLERGVYDMDTFLERRDEINKRILTTESIISENQISNSNETLIEQIETVLNEYWSGSAYERNQLIKAVVKKAAYTKPKGSGWGALPVIEVTKWNV